jgi:transcriptional regulator with XRE-family HTH domain
MELRVNPFGERIRLAREAASITQVELAAQLGVSPRTVQNWETSDRMPQPKHRRAIAAFLEEVEGAAA